MNKQEKERLQYLLLQYLEGRATQSEQHLLSALLAEEKNGPEWENIMEELMAAETAMADYRPDEWQPLIEALVVQNALRNKPRKLRRIKRFWPAAVAALLVLAIGIGMYFYKHPTPAPVAEVKAPETNRAVIILGNGQKIYLDSAVNGQLALQSNIKLVKIDNGKIVYAQSEQATNAQPEMNTLSNPRGSRVIDMVLSDGSHVWLNAGSSVTYPVSFTGKERKLTITGEAYFEVTKNAAMPFKVNVNNKMEVEVLGTHFNVSAYENENSINTTLLEGSVRVHANGQTQLLTPGQQAQLTAKIEVVNDADINQVTAWKNGLFNFTGMGCAEVMRQLERWYDIEVVYEQGVPNISFGGKITKTVPLNGLLIGLKKLDLHFRLEGRKLIILP